ncbi:MAG: copper resistance protein CopC [Nitrososphaera sp.]
MGRRLLYVPVMVAVAALLIVNVQQASAHPILTGSDPRPFASVSSTPPEVTVHFSEAIEIDYSKIAVLGPDGSRVDRNDPGYADGDTASLRVSLQPNLPEGVYTVTTRVLSAVDGHVVDNAFTFGIGVAPVETDSPSAPQSDVLSPEESTSRFPGMVGQIIVVGAAFGTLWLWKPLEKVPWLANAVAARRHEIDRKMLGLVIIGTGLVLASNAAMISVQAYEINASIGDAIATKFGTIWTTRMIESSILMIIAVFVQRKMAREGAIPSRAEMIAILVMGLAVLVTSSLISHGAATGQTAAILLDFFHNAAASIWIGGVVLMGFVVVPRLLALSDERARPAAISILIPRFSTVVVTILGLSVITGPLLLFMIEDNLSLTLASTYGRVLIIKLALAGVMVGMGAYSQAVVQKKAVAAMAGGQSIQHTGVGRYGRTLKAEAGVGIALLLMVSLMANGALPEGEFPQYAKDDTQSAFAQAPADRGYVQTLITSAGRIDLAVKPYAVGQNTFTLSFFDLDGKPASGIESASVKMTNVERGIGPITVETAKKSEGVYTAEAAFGIAGTWSVVVEGVRPESTNIVASIDLDVGPAVSDLAFELTEYRIPASRSLPLFPVLDGERNSIWVGDSLPVQGSTTGKIWQLDMATGNYTLHEVQGAAIITQMALDGNGMLWYIDPTGILGMYDPDTRANKNFQLPQKGIVSGLVMDGDGNLWMPVVQLNRVFRFDPSTEQFTYVDLPTAGSIPVAVSLDRNGNVWVAESGSDRIAMIDTKTGAVTEYAPPGSNKLDEPTVVFQDPDSNTLFISEHTGHTVTAFNPLFETFREYPSVNDGGLPFGMAKDRFGNLWYAQHEIDRIAVLDPRTGQGTEVKIPTPGSFVQYILSDDLGNIWIAEQQGAKIGKIVVTAKPPTQQPGPEEPEPEQQAEMNLPLADYAGPGIAAGIIIAGLLYAKSATDLRRNVREASKLG